MPEKDTPAFNSFSADKPAALQDIRVLDLTTEMGVYCTKLLADLGADVIRVESPKGNPARSLGPYYHDESDPQRSLFHFHFNTNKRSITLNLENPDAREVLKKLVKSAEVLVESFPVGYMAKLGLDYDSLKKLNPGLIYCSISGFGQEGPYSKYKAPDIVGVAMGGLMYLGGYPDEAPFYPGAFQGYHLASVDAAIGILIALYHRDLTGEGQHVDMSMEESVCEAIEMGMVLWDVRKVVRKRTGRRVFRDWNEVFPCEDGYVMCSPFGGAGWQKIFEWVDSEGKAADLKEPIYQQALKVMAWGQMDVAALPPDIDKELLTKNPQLVTHIEEVWQQFLMTHTREELFKNCQERDVRLMPIYDSKDIYEDPQMVERNFFVDVKHPELNATIKYPGGPYRFKDTPWRIKSRAPLIGEHNPELYEKELGMSKDEIAILKKSGGI
ncbi:MAG: CoA transferase [Chloroflexi bacterium]|nr:CoA transferase [Chloroflexota bacterium]